MLEKGTLLQGCYRIETVMERREQAILYKAYDEILLQDVIVKEFFCEKNRLRKEAERFFGRSEWSGILQIKDFFEENETVYLVLEYIAKRTMKEYLKGIPQKQYSWNMAVGMLMPILKMMSLMHAEGMVFGKVTIGDFWLREDGTCCLISVGENAVSKDTAAEQGPWSDVYEICGVLQELLKGKENNEQVRQAICQGRNAEIQQRYFYFGSFLERLFKNTSGIERKDLEEIWQLREKIQEIWGDKWLEITTASEHNSDAPKQKKLRMTRSRIRKIKRISSLVILLAVVLSGILIWKDRQPKTKQEILEALQQLEPANKIGDETIYSVSKSFALKYRMISNYENTFAVKKEKLLSWFQNFYDLDLLKASSVEWSSLVSVDADDVQAIQIYNYETAAYVCSAHGKNLKVSVKYDIIDDSVYAVEIESEKELCKEIMRNLLPVLVPGTYLTEEEAEVFLTYLNENRFYTYKKHGKYGLNLQRSTDDDSAKIEFYNYPKYEEAEPELVRAGNYERTSEKYQEFIEFLKDQSVAVEELENGKRYTLDETAVKEWGEVCNAYLFDISAEEIRTVLTDRYGAELEKEDTILEAAVYEGGAIETFFVKREKYDCEGSVRILLVSDYISGKVNRIYVFDEENNKKRAAHYIKGTVSLVSNAFDDAAESDWKEKLQEYQENIAEDSSAQMYLRMKDCGISFLQIDDLAGICIQRILWEGIDCAPYNWP